MLKENARRRDADGAGALNVLRLLQIEDLPAHQPRHADPPEAHECDRYHHVVDHPGTHQAVKEGVVLDPAHGFQYSRTQRRGDDDDEQDAGERRGDLADPHDELVYLPAEVPRHETERDPDDQSAREHPYEGEDDRVLDPPEETGEDITSRAIGARPVFEARRLAEGRVVLVGVLVARHIIR